MRRGFQQTTACVGGQDAADPRARRGGNRRRTCGRARHPAATRSVRAGEAILEKGEVVQVDVVVTVHVGETAARSGQTTWPSSAPPRETYRAGEKQEHRDRFGDNSIVQVIPASGVADFVVPDAPDDLRLVVGYGPWGTPESTSSPSMYQAYDAVPCNSTR